MVQFLLLNHEPERETSTTRNFNGVNYNNLINISYLIQHGREFCKKLVKLSNFIDQFAK